MDPQLRIRLVTPAELLLGRVNIVWSPALIELRVDETAGVDPAAITSLMELGEQRGHELLALDPAHPPVVRFRLERDISGGRLVDLDVGPGQVDVYVRPELMPQAIADEIGGHVTHLLRTFRL